VAGHFALAVSAFLFSRFLSIYMMAIDHIPGSNAT